ncbi:ABC transporter substrate-binding protein [Diplocloster modestus]|uniref:ABC transporter substrate-binding protein n=1 Tax=Diplocloster modestus TaxID=2850322 RepID=A0ABS6KAL0_9FIRM|nr:PhnD/SsuA/transferrin family substrate-binding protein [Diplocloster modestus]MBU9727536.1 ABC transporter substrate-binding protein [Diplocloster modestus]
MKKLFVVMVTLCMAAGLLAGCGSEGNGSSNPAASATPAAKPEESAAPAAETPGPLESSQTPSGTDDETVIHVGALKGPTSMGMVKLMADSDAGTTAARYEFSIHGAVDEMTPKIVQGDFDIAAVPANLASVLYNNTKGQISVLAVNTLGVLYIVENGETVQSVADLKGKTLYASGKGATPEYALNYILKSNGLDPAKDLTIEYKSEHTECVAALAADPAGVAMLPQPFVTTAQVKNPDIRVALDLSREWDNAQEGQEVKSSLVTGVVVARNDFIEAHPDLVHTFMDEYRASIEYVNGNVEDAAKLVGSYDIVPEEVAVKALPACNIVFMEGSEMKDALSGYLSVLMEQNPKAVGGALPDETFYYNR